MCKHKCLEAVNVGICQISSCAAESFLTLFGDRSLDAAIIKAAILQHDAFMQGRTKMCAIKIEMIN